MNEEIYVHYGSTYFDKERFKLIKNRMFINKPYGGLWASPVNAKFGWKEWCEQEQYADCKEENSFKFKLSDNAKIFHIYSNKDIFKLPLQKSIANFICLDFEKILEIGYDAIELHLSSEKSVDNIRDSLYFSLYGWDCDSILVMNPDVVIQLASGID